MTFNMFSQAEVVLTLFASLELGFQVIERTFVLSPGFYWQTVETLENVYRGRETTQR